jgi:transcriptional regulator with XRE-family HTH domain
MTGRFRRVDEIPQDRAAVVGANIRVLRQQHGWNQAKLGELMGWPSNSTVCAAEGRRNGRQRGFTTQEVERLAAIFGLSPAQLTMEWGCPALTDRADSSSGYLLECLFSG